MAKRTAASSAQPASKRPKTAQSTAAAAKLPTHEEIAQRPNATSAKGKARANLVEPESDDDESEGDGELYEEEDDGEAEDDIDDSGLEDDDSEVNEFELDDDDFQGDDDEELGLDQDEDEGSDSDSDSGSAASDEPAPPPAALKKANVRNSRQAKALKPQELRALAFAELTASPISGFISTEVGELLPPLTPPAPATSPLQPLLKSLHAHITSLPSQKPISLAALKKKGVVVPAVEGSEGKWGEMEFAWEKPRPEDVRIVGRWAWGGGIKVKGEYTVEMAIAMPTALLQPKDYLSPRFLIKSTHYLTTLASHFPSSLGPVTLSYVPLPSLGYALEIRAAPPTGEKVGLAKTKGAVLRLRVVAPPSFFPLAKLSPLSNIARPSSASATSTTALPPSPLRTSSLLASHLSTLTSHLTFHHSLSTSNSSYASSIRLLQTWAAKRNYPSSLGVSDEFWAWCVARTLNWGASAGGGGGVIGGDAWAGWRKTVEWLAGVEWTEGVWFRVEGEESFEKDDFRTAFKGKPLFVDPTGTVNLAAGIELSTLEMIRHDAKVSIALLMSDADEEDKFDRSLVRPVREAERFDNFVRITVPASALSSVEASAGLDHPSALEALVSGLSSTLRRALGTRIKAFHLSTPQTPSIAVQGATSVPSSIIVSVGILLESGEAGRLVDQGPSAEDEAACAEFRAFWGRKSELRRFKDGAIVESVVWDDQAPNGLGQQRSAIVGQIVRYIVEARHGIPTADIEVFAGSMDHLLVEPEAVRKAIFLQDPVASGRGFTSVLEAYEALSKELKGLSDLPLAVSAIQPSTPGLRYSTIFTPAPRRLKGFERFPDSTKFIDVHEILLTLEGSGRWPEDLEGVQKIKAAFLSKIAEGLSSLQTVYKAEVAFDLEARPIDDNVSLEVLTATGFAFRARIFYERSLLLLKNRETKLGGSPSSTESASSLDVYQERFVHGRRHHAALSSLQHHFTSYSPTVRLVKRWLSAHMLSAYFPPELVELIAASVFIDPASMYDVPQSGATGFARVMETLASWKWRDEPLLVALYSFSVSTTAGKRPVVAKATRDAATRAFEARRLADPAVNEFAWVVCTEQDPQGKVWGRRTGKVAAGRVKGLARSTLKTLQDGLVGGSLVIEQLFNPPLGDYAFLIHLDASVVPRHFQSLSPDPKAIASRPRSSVLSGSVMGEPESDSTIRLGWDPVGEFVAQVENLYPSTFLLFHSPDGAPTIGGIWNPSAECPRAWKTGLGFPCRPVEEGGGKARVEMDKEAVLREIQALGKGLVERVEVV